LEPRGTGGIGKTKSDSMSQKVRMRVLVPALLILVAFLAGFPIWMRSPHSPGGRIFAYVFGAILITLFVVEVIGKIGLLIFGRQIIRDWRQLLKL
jgi:hypothetical protein